MKRSPPPTRKASLKNSELRRKSSLRSSGKPGRKPRKASERLRIYGPPGRVEFVKSLPCVVCGVWAPSENAHVVGGGMGRKADAAHIVPLCGVKAYAPTEGCHAILHRLGVETFQARFGVDLRAEAAKVEAMWQATLTREIL